MDYQPYNFALSNIWYIISSIFGCITWKSVDRNLFNFFYFLVWKIVSSLWKSTERERASITCIFIYICNMGESICILYFITCINICSIYFEYHIPNTFPSTLTIDLKMEFCLCIFPNTYNIQFMKISLEKIYFSVFIKF